MYISTDFNIMSMIQAYGGDLREAQGYNSEEDVNNYQGIAENLLDIRNASRWDAEPRDDPSVIKCFEPKFMQVFGKYCECVKQICQPSSHLMSACLENLIPFCCWARENITRVMWIKEVLEDNADLRPEVRNGLAMILIYTLATSKASNSAEDLDMFATLRDADTGLGIVNKTSLKIYNDPYNFFSFLKSCMSGLIDAGKIPENERQNQVSKPNPLFVSFIISSFLHILYSRKSQSGDLTTKVCLFKTYTSSSYH